MISNNVAESVDASTTPNGRAGLRRSCCCRRCSLFPPACVAVPAADIDWAASRSNPIAGVAAVAGGCLGLGGLVVTWAATAAAHSACSRLLAGSDVADAPMGSCSESTSGDASPPLVRMRIPSAAAAAVAAMTAAVSLNRTRLDGLDGDLLDCTTVSCTVRSAPAPPPLFPPAPARLTNGARVCVCVAATAAAGRREEGVEGRRKGERTSKPSGRKKQQQRCFAPLAYNCRNRIGLPRPTQHSFAPLRLFTRRWHVHRPKVCSSMSV